MKYKNNYKKREEREKKLRGDFNTPSKSRQRLLIKNHLRYTSDEDISYDDVLNTNKQRMKKY